MRALVLYLDLQLYLHLSLAYSSYSCTSRGGLLALITRHPALTRVTSYDRLFIWVGVILVSESWMGNGLERTCKEESMITEGCRGRS